MTEVAAVYIQSESPKALRYVAETVRLLALMQPPGSESQQLTLKTCFELSELVLTKLSDEEPEEHESLVGVFAYSLCFFLLLGHGATAQQLLTKAFATRPELREDLFSAHAEFESTDYDQTVTGLLAAFIAKLDPSQPESSQVLQSVRAHAEREIDFALEYEFRFNRELMHINDEEEEALFFEITDRSLIESDAKERLLKSFVEREQAVIKEIL